MVNPYSALDEANRLVTLQLMGIDGTHEVEGFDHIVRLACLLTAAPVATLSFIGEGKEWYKSVSGMDSTDLNAAGLQLESYPCIYKEPITFTGNLLLGYLIIAFPQLTELNAVQREGLYLLSVQLVTLLQLRMPAVNHRMKNLYESILNNIPTDIVVFDADHRYLFANPGAIRDAELRKFIIGKDDFEYAAFRNKGLEMAKKRRAQFLDVKDKGRAVGWEESQTDPTGKSITYLRRMFPIHDDEGNLTMVIGLGLDITDRKELENKQHRILEQLSVQHKQSIDFCNVVSHNLRGPLVNLGMLAEFILEAEDPLEQRLLVAKMEPVIDKLKSTFNELVESIQVRQETDLVRDELFLQQCLNEAVSGLFVELKKAGGHIQADFSAAPVVYFPRKYLSGIFYNLISNAILYQSPARALQIVLYSERKGDKLLLTVADNGLGIDLLKYEDQLFKMGKVFHRRPGAKGLGLFMTRTQVESMGGRIWVESVLDQGAKFYIEFVCQPVS